jgi:hypothetical protein
MYAEYLEHEEAEHAAEAVAATASGADHGHDHRILIGDDELGDNHDDHAGEEEEHEVFPLPHVVFVLGFMLMLFLD